LAAATLPILMVRTGAGLLVRDWNAHTGGREAHTIGFGIGQFLSSFSIATFLVGVIAAKPFLKLLRRK